MVSFRVLAPALLALAGCVVAQDVEQTTSTTTQTESTPTLSTTETLATQTLSSATLSNQTTTSSTQSFSSLTTSGPTTLSQVVLTTTTASTQTVPTPTKSNKKEKVRRKIQTNPSAPPAPPYWFSFSDIGCSPTSPLSSQSTAVKARTRPSSRITTVTCSAPICKRSREKKKKRNPHFPLKPN